MVAFATGALLGAALLGLLPEAIELAGPDGYQSVGSRCWAASRCSSCWKSWCSGATATRTIARRTRRTTACHRRSSGAMVIIGDTVHNVLDGVLIAAAFLIDVHLGVMTGLAVLAHEVPSEVGDFAVLLHSGMSRARACSGTCCPPWARWSVACWAISRSRGLRPGCPMRWAFPPPACSMSPWPTSSPGCTAGWT